MMIQNLAGKITVICVAAEESEITKVKVQYGLELLFETFVKLIGILGIALIFGVEKEVFTAMVSLCILRHYAGGVHMQGSLGCFICSAGICFLPHFIGKQIAISLFWNVVLLICSYLLIWKYAPFSTENNLITEPEIKKRNNRMSRIVIIIVAIIALLWLKKRAYLITIPIFLESITILPIWRKKYNEENNQFN